MRRPAADLRRRPIFVVDARKHGMSRGDLQRKDWRRLSYGQYAWKGLGESTRLTLRAVTQRMPSSYAFSGRTAAWIHGLDMPPCNPVEVTVPREAPVRARAGLRLRRAALTESDVVTVGEFRTTSPLRTARDLGSGGDIVEAVVAIDMALGAGFITLSELDAFVAANAGAKGIKRLRRATALADARAESPMETRLRVELAKARLPRPMVQADLHDSSGRFLGRADLYYPDRRLVIEYDGENHTDRLTSDRRRQNALLSAGYQLLRFTAADLRTPNLVAAQVRHERARLERLSVGPDFAA